MNILRWKPAHFVLVGLVAYWVLAPGAQRTELAEPLALGPERVEALRQGWIATMGRPPQGAELAALVRRETDEEILFREAIARSLHTLDAVVRQRLLLNMRFLEPGTQDDDEELFARALQLEMHRNDVVVRRRLVQIMELSIQANADRSPASAAELAAMYAKRREELALPARWRVTHVYFSADRRGERAADDARAALVELERLAPGTDAPPALGDPFLGGHRLPLLSATQLAGQFGEEFAAALPGCATGRWCGPMRSSYGQHLVLVEEAEAARLPAVDDPEVRRRLESEVLRERADRALAAAMVDLRRAYGVDP